RLLPPRDVLDHHDGSRPLLGLEYRREHLCREGYPAWPDEIHLSGSISLLFPYLKEFPDTRILPVNQAGSPSHHDLFLGFSEHLTCSGICREYASVRSREQDAHHTML